MSRNSGGTYTAPANSWNPAVEGSAIDEADWNATLTDLESALTDSLDRTGKGKITAHIDFDENASPGTPDSNVGRLYVGDDGGVTTLYFKDAAGNVYNLNLAAASGLPFTFNSTTTTNADPGAGKGAFNNATISSATEMALSTTTSGGADVAAYMATWDDTGTSDRGRLLVQKRTDASKLYIYTISGATVDGSGYKRITLTYVAGSGAISNTDPLAVTFLPPGSAGAAGASGLDWDGAWQTATAYVLNDGVSNGGSSYICTQAHTSGASTEPGVGASWASYWDVFAAKGSDGAGTGDVTAASAFATDNVIIRSDGTSKGVQASAVAIDDTGNVSGVVALSTTTIELGHASDTTLARSAAGTVTVEGKQVLLNSQTATISKGFTLTPNNIGTVSSGTTTPDPANGNYQYYTNGGAHTLAAPSSDCAIDILVTNNGSAGAITFSGFTVGSSTGSALTTTNTSKFIISIRRINSISTYSVYALQ